MKSSMAVVTGATSGIGKSLTSKLASQGLTVFAIGRNKGRLDQLQDLECHKNIIPWQCDITREEDLSVAVAQLHQLSEKHELKYLVHNATALNPISPLTEVSFAEMEDQMRVNVTGPMTLTNHLNTLMKPDSRIFFISTGASRAAVPHLVPHCAAKAAQATLALGFKDALKTKNIHVGIIEPGIVNTPAQEYVRSLSPETLPFSDIARKAFEEGRCCSSEECSELLFGLLHNSDDDIFTSKWPWQFSNPEHMDELKQLIQTSAIAPGTR
jgi:benzil reductase ((S)-benzoin forming)